MEQITWSDEFSVGVSLFDRQHKKLVGMLNAAIANPSATTRSEPVADILAGMTRYALEHFKSEEDLMVAHGYPLLEEHRAQHEGFWKKLTELSMATTKGDDTVPRALLDFLQQWLTRHILQEDMQYKAFFQKKGVK